MDFFADLTNEVLESLDSDWYATDSELLETCCGVQVEYDAHHCPECGAPNPLVGLGMI